MKVYLAATFARKEEMKRYRLVLNAIGIEVTSRWIDVDQPEPLGPNTLDANPDIGLKYARTDIEDINKADWIILFGDSGPGSSRGGHNVELGYAIALGMPVHLVGSRENVFYGFAVHGHETFQDHFKLLDQWIKSGWRPHQWRQ